MDSVSNEIQTTLTDGGGVACASRDGSSDRAMGLSSGALAGEVILSLKSSGPMPQSSVHPTQTLSNVNSVYSTDDNSTEYARDNANNETYSIYSRRQHQKTLNNRSGKYENTHHCTQADLERAETCPSSAKHPPYKIGYEAKEEELEDNSVDLLKVTYIHYTLYLILHTFP